MGKTAIAEKVEGHLRHAARCTVEVDY